MTARDITLPSYFCPWQHSHTNRSRGILFVLPLHPHALFCTLGKSDQYTTEGPPGEWRCSPPPPRNHPTYADQPAVSNHYVLSVHSRIAQEDLTDVHISIPLCVLDWGESISCLKAVPHWPSFCLETIFFCLNIARCKNQKKKPRKTQISAISVQCVLTFTTVGLQKNVSNDDILGCRFRSCWSNWIQ